MNTSKAQISELTGRGELDEVGRFRYRVYVEEMARPQMYADHYHRTIIEPLDENSTILVARAAGSVVGTLRISFCNKANLSDYEQKYGLHQFSPFFPSYCAVTTKMMVGKEFRCSTLPMQLMYWAYRHECQVGNLFDMIDCNTHLRPMFIRYGYRQVMPNYVDEEYGTVTPLVLALGDQDHLTHCRSPFRRYCPDTVDARASVKWFHEKFAVLPEPPPVPANRPLDEDGVHIFEKMQFPDCC